MRVNKGRAFNAIIKRSNIYTNLSSNGIEGRVIKVGEGSMFHTLGFLHFQVLNLFELLSLFNNGSLVTSYLGTSSGGLNRTPFGKVLLLRKGREVRVVF